MRNPAHRGVRFWAGQNTCAQHNARRQRRFPKGVIFQHRISAHRQHNDIYVNNAITVMTTSTTIHTNT